MIGLGPVLIAVGCLTTNDGKEATLLSVESPEVLVMKVGAKPTRIRLIGVGNPTRMFRTAEQRQAFKSRHNATVRLLCKDVSFEIQYDPKFPVKDGSPAPAYLVASGVSLNATIVATGELPADPEGWDGAERIAEIVRAEKEAKDEKIGIWDPKYMDSIKSDIPSHFLPDPEYAYYPVGNQIDVEKNPIVPGSTFYAFSVDGSRLVGACDYFSYTDYAKFQAAGDEDGISELIEKERAVVLSKGTQLKVIETKLSAGLFAVEVRVVGGKYDGKLFWMRISQLAFRKEMPTKKRR